MNGNYPEGAQYDSKAPYNQRENKPLKVDVCASNTLHKSTSLEVKDYNIENEDNCFKDCDLNRAWEDQDFTVKETLIAAKKFAQSVANIANREGWGTLESAAKKIFAMCDGWEEDEFEIVLE